jgi:putative flippase GtrA
MKTKLSELPDTPKQLIKYGSVGVLNVIIYFGVNYFLINNFDFFADHIVTASVIASVISFSNGLYFNRKWTFKSKTHWLQDSILVLIFFGICTFVQSSVLAFSVLNLGKYIDATKEQILYLSQSLAVVVFAGLNFSLNKFITFRKTESKS